MVASRFTEWRPHTALGVRSAYHLEFLMGSFDGRNDRPTSPPRLEPVYRLLWQLDSGRKFLCVSINEQRQDRHLGNQRKGIVSKIGVHPRAADIRSNQRLGSTVRQRR